MTEQEIREEIIRLSASIITRLAENSSGYARWSCEVLVADAIRVVTLQEVLGGEVEENSEMCTCGHYSDEHKLLVDHVGECDHRGKPDGCMCTEFIEA